MKCFFNRMMRVGVFLMAIVIGCFLVISCSDKISRKSQTYSPVDSTVSLPQSLYSDTCTVPHTINIGHFFEFLDSLIVSNQSQLPYVISEHLILRSNPWILNKLVESDYYRLKNNPIYLHDQRLIPILEKGEKIYIPGRALAEFLIEEQKTIWLDVNIPEYCLRIIRGGKTIDSIRIRVGQNRSRFLAMTGRVTNLRTPIGTGKIVRIIKDPDYFNPVDNKKYSVTRRDDGNVTLLPRIPWLEPEINGVRTGHLIHPTTNPVTLGKPYSNGCIGVSEGDAWKLYYYAPVGTRIKIRYDLHINGRNGDSIRLPDIYGLTQLQRETDD